MQECCIDQRLLARREKWGQRENWGQSKIIFNGAAIQFFKLENNFTLTPIFHPNFPNEVLSPIKLGNMNGLLIH